jgi:transcriptional regulator
MLRIFTSRRRVLLQMRAQAVYIAGFSLLFSPVDNQQIRAYLLLIINRRLAISASRTEVLQGTLDLMVLKTLDSMGAQHGYGIARRIEQLSNDLLRMNQGTLYPALLRLEQRGWISSKWGLSGNNRRAKFYSITRAGQKQLTAETENWERVAGIMSRLLRTPQGA